MRATKVQRFFGPDGTPRIACLKDDDGVYHLPIMFLDQGKLRPDRDEAGWYMALCYMNHCGPLVLARGATCILCLTK